MSPIAAGQGDAGDWKGGHMRINSSEARVSNSNCSKADEAELQDRSRVAAAATANDDTTSAANNGKRANKGGRGRLQFPRFGLDALIHESRPEGDPNEDGTFHFYKVYKRRWFGLAQLTLLNIIISWEVSLPVCRSFPSPDSFTFMSAPTSRSMLLRTCRVSRRRGLARPAGGIAYVCQLRGRLESTAWATMRLYSPRAVMEVSLCRAVLGSRNNAPHLFTFPSRPLDEADDVGSTVRYIPKMADIPSFLTTSG